MAAEALDACVAMPVSDSAASFAVRDGAPEIPVPTEAGPWDGIDYLSNEEALRLLMGRNSGIRPLYDRRGYRTLKRAFDVCASGAAIAVLAIPSSVLCVVICAKSPGASPIYSQWRIGRVNKDGSFKAFRMLKFRSMVPGADQILAELQEQNEASGPMFKINEGIRHYGSRLRWSGGVCGSALGLGGTNLVRIVQTRMRGCGSRAHGTVA